MYIYKIEMKARSFALNAKDTHRGKRSEYEFVHETKSLFFLISFLSRIRAVCVCVCVFVWST